MCKYSDCQPSRQAFLLGFLRFPVFSSLFLLHPDLLGEIIPTPIFALQDTLYQTIDIIMDNNHTEDYVLVLEDRTEVQNASEVGKLSIISDINEEGELKTTAAEATNQSSFLKFNNQDGLLKNFMKNFLKQLNDPTRFGLYKVLASNVEQGVESLRSSLQNRRHPASEELLKAQQVSFEDFLPMQKRATAIDPEKIDWRMLEDLGLSREKLEASGALEKMLSWQKSDLLPFFIPSANS